MTPTPAGSGPLYFGHESATMFGWLHRPAVPSARGLVICNPLGHEAITAHRALRTLAEAAAAAGVAVVRFDYPGSGDSAGDEPGIGRVATCLDGIDAAVDLLRQETGVSDVYLLGLRFGGGLAMAYAAKYRAVAGLVLWAPSVSGRQFTREWHALATMAAARRDAPPDDVPVLDPDVDEVVGFRVDPDTKADLRAIDLGSLGTARAGAALVIGRDDLPREQPIVDALGTMDVPTRYDIPPGYQAMMVEDPRESLLPEETITAIVGWLGEEREPAVVTDGGQPVVVATSLTAGPVTEHAVLLGGDRRLLAIVSEPLEAAPVGPTLVLFDAGSVHRIGPGRLYVRLARHCAARGQRVVRVDFGGIGDSPALAGARENKPYDDPAVDDTELVLRYAHGLDADGTVALGLCAGAYNLFHALLRGAPLDAAVLVNPIVFYWHGDDAEDGELADPRVMAAATNARRALFQPERWRAVARGEVDVARVARRMAKRARIGVAATNVRARRRLGFEVGGEDVLRDLTAIVAGGVGTTIVMGSSEPGLAYLRLQAGSRLAPFLERDDVDLVTIDGLDHVFAEGWAKDRLESIVAGVSAQVGTGRGAAAPSAPTRPAD